jgi:hypothetical protein
VLSIALVTETKRQNRAKRPQGGFGGCNFFAAPAPKPVVFILLFPLSIGYQGEFPAAAAGFVGHIGLAAKYSGLDSGVDLLGEAAVFHKPHPLAGMEGETLFQPGVLHPAGRHPINQGIFRLNKLILVEQGVHPQRQGGFKPRKTRLVRQF